MPMISVKTNTAIPVDKEVILKTKLGEAIALIPGKNESRLMISFEDNVRMYFSGKNDTSMAYVEVDCLGQSTREAYTKVTAAICDMMKAELGIAPGSVYVRYDEAVHWGWNGKNF